MFSFPLRDDCFVDEEPRDFLCYHQYNSSSIVSVFTTDLSCSAHPLVNFQNRFQRVYLVQKGKQRGAPKINAQAHMTTEFFFVFIASFEKKKKNRQPGKADFASS